MNKMNIILNGIIKENPTFVLLLGMCPTLGTTSSAENGMGMGLATEFGLLDHGDVVNCCGKDTKNRSMLPLPLRGPGHIACGCPKLCGGVLEIPAFIVIIAAFVTILEMCMKAYVPALYASLGLFIPLIVVNCIVLGRAESFAAKHNAFDSMLDGVGIGLGFTGALTLLGAVREFLGTGKIFSVTIFPEQYGALVFVLAPGAFIVLGYLILIVNKLKTK